ncbi:MAG: AMP-binding protein [Candidatus Rokubacteria bacterium]|nr:AMP-binding protein [Candidatus Rokubacteria bacterium]
MTLGELLDRAALRRPDAPAVVDGARRLSYAELAARAAAVAGGLSRLGVSPRDRVLLALKNRLEHVVAYWALQRLGGVPAPVNFRFAAGEMTYVLEDSGATVALFEAATAPAVLEAARGRDVRLVGVGDDVPAGALPFAELERAGPTPAARPVTEGDLSLILYTSGTTGRPKGVPRTHKNHYAGALAHALQCGYTWGERTLGVMPLYHTMGIHSLTSMAAVNGCFACQPDWSAAGALGLVAGERLTALYLIPTLFWELVHAPELARTDVSSVRKLAYAGAPMLVALTEACAKAFRPDVFVNHYGSTEIYTFSILPDVRLKPGCAGKPGLHAKLRVVVASPERRVGPDEVVPPGTKGEIIASLDSDEAFAGYWNRPDADARALRAGWYYSGDMGWVDADGDLWVAGRVDDMIISGGENIHPVEVEDALARHPGVKDVAVIGEPDEKWGERVVAFVVPGVPGLTAEDLDGHCRATADLANFKRPRRVVFVNEIPKTASGKILRRLLRDGQYTEVRP